MYVHTMNRPHVSTYDPINLWNQNASADHSPTVCGEQKQLSMNSEEFSGCEHTPEMSFRQTQPLILPSAEKRSRMDLLTDDDMLMFPEFMENLEKSQHFTMKCFLQQISRKSP